MDDDSQTAKAITKMTNVLATVQTGIAVLKQGQDTLREEVRGDVAEIKEGFKNHGKRIRHLEISQADLKRGQQAIKDDLNTRLGIVGVVSTIAGAIAGFVSGLRN